MTRFFAITKAQRKAQRKALFIVFQRDFPGWISPTRRKEGIADHAVCVLGRNFTGKPTRRQTWLSSALPSSN